ncbi:MAG: 3-oxoadipate enol-lactonase [Sulfitobacter dubius]
MEALEFEWGKMHLNVRNGSGPDLVFVNSLGTDLRMWDAVIHRLPSTWVCVRMDKRGHGLSDTAPASYSLSDLATDVIAAMDRAKITRGVIVGCSVGGLIAQQIALMAPDRVVALVLSNTASKLGAPEAWRDRAEGIRENGMGPMANAILPRWFGPEMLKRPEADLWRNLLSRTDTQGYIATCEAIAQADVTPCLSRILQPALVIGGRHDQATPPETVEALAENLPRADFAMFENSGHLPAIEEPAAFAEMLTRYVERVTP